MKFTGQQVSLSHTELGITIRMDDGKDKAVLVLSPTEAAQFLAYLLGIFNLVETLQEISSDEDDEEEISNKRVTH